jgi:type VI secretion system protein ImpB
MAGKESSVAPKERINIRYVPATGDQQEEMELPLRLVMLGDYLGREDDTPLEEREMLSVDKNSFASVMEEAGLERELNVKNTLSDEEDARLSVNLEFKALKDFEPDAVVKQVPELEKLIELREALVALKGPLGNIPAFRKRLEQILEDEESRNKLMEELQNLGLDAEKISVGDKVPPAEGDKKEDTQNDSED